MVARLFQFNEGWDKGARSPEPPNFRECHAEMETVFHIFQMRALAFATNAGSHSRCRRLDEMCEISGRIGFHGVVRSLWTERYVRHTAGFTVNYHPLPTYNWFGITKVFVNEPTRLGFRTSFMCGNLIWDQTSYDGWTAQCKTRNMVRKIEKVVCNVPCLA